MVSIGIVCNGAYETRKANLSFCAAGYSKESLDLSETSVNVGTFVKGTLTIAHPRCFPCQTQPRTCLAELGN